MTQPTLKSFIILENGSKKFDPVFGDSKFHYLYICMKDTNKMN